MKHGRSLSAFSIGSDERRLFCAKSPPNMSRAGMFFASAAPFFSGPSIAASKAVVVMLCVAVAAGRAHAQDRTAGNEPDRAQKNRSPLWVRAGTEMQFFGDDVVGIGLGAAAASHRWGGVISIRRGFAGEVSFEGFFDAALFPITLLVDSSSARTPMEHRWEAGVLYGRRWEPAHFVLSAAAGLGLAGGRRRGALLEPSPAAFEPNVYEEKSFVTVGVPLEVQVTWTPFSFLGIGIHLSGNLNVVGPFGGMGTHLLIGRLR
jgi:hypothetical protein